MTTTSSPAELDRRIAVAERTRDDAMSMGHIAAAARAADVIDALVDQRRAAGDGAPHHSEVMAIAERFVATLGGALDRVTAERDAAANRIADLADERDAARRRAEVAEAELGVVLDILGRRKRATYTRRAAALASDGEAEELAEARGRWDAQAETLAQVLRALDRD